MKTVLKFVVVTLLLSPLWVHSQEPKFSSDLAQRVQIQKLLEEVQQLRIQVASCRANLADVQAKFDSSFLSNQNQDLKSKHEQLEAEIRKSLGGKEGDTIDWTTDPPTLVKKKP